jgi:anti-sigma regulatory factor (Ser/Thr protein kinase)
MATTATETTSLMAITLPSTRYSAWMARYYVRAALKLHGLDGYAADAATVTSELVTNAIIHTNAETISLGLARLQDTAEIAIVVTDPSPSPPAKRDLADAAECGRGLHIVELLSARWGWEPQNPGKTVYAILTREA